jgi:hypothetical protein
MRTRATLVLTLAFCALAVSQALAVSSDVRISQVYAGGSAGRAWNQDYVELFNASGSPVNVSNWVIALGGANATWLDVVFGFPQTTIIPACSYYLVALGPVQSDGASVPADVSCASVFCALDSPAGQVGLKFLNSMSGEPCSFFTWHDVVGYGPTPCYEGAGPAPGTGGTAASYRASGGLTDTDNNNLDFASNTAVPRSSASPANTACLATPTRASSWGRVKSIYR